MDIYVYFLQGCTCSMISASTADFIKHNEKRSFHSKKLKQLNYVYPFLEYYFQNVKCLILNKNCNFLISKIMLILRLCLDTDEGN